MRRVAQRLPLLNLLVEERKRVLQMRRLLLVERRHAELLVDERLVLATGRPVPVVRVVSEGGLVQVAQVRHHGVDSTEEAFVLCARARNAMCQLFECR